MKKFFKTLKFVPVAALVFAVTACNGGKQSEQTENTPAEQVADSTAVENVDSLNVQ